jgi:NTP pyrophosphatase (non-canonical NTP hydrolase)
MDNTTTLQDLKLAIDKFIKERDWHHNHTSKDIAMDISVEAGELLEIFLWQPENKLNDIINNPAKFEHIQEELADVLFGVLDFATTHNIDISHAMYDKLRKNEQKYPVSKAKGNNLKYTEYDKD